jgi:C4-dicarboxylate-specific signal transduction histidine kinase
MKRNGLRNRIVWATSLQLLLVSGAVGGMAYFSGQRSGLSLTDAYRQQDAITNLSDQLSSRLRDPQLINNLNVLAIEQGRLSLTNFDAMGQRFWSQMQLFPVGYTNYGNPRGEFLGVERLDSGEFVLNEDASTSRLGKGSLGIYAMGPGGERGKLLDVVPGMTTTHEEAWYVETVKAGKATWSSIYHWEDKPDVLAISYNQPLYGPGRQLLGVIGVDFVLSQLNTWLAEVWKDELGFALIVEPDGMVVASSRPELINIATGNKSQRLHVNQLRDPLARLTARAVFPASRPKRMQTIDHNGARFMVDLHPWGQAEGLNWLLITANPSDQVIQASQRHALMALLASLGAIATAVLVTIRVSDWLLAPLELLRQRCQSATDQINPWSAEPRFNAQLPEGTATEIGAVSEAFGGLVHRLSQAQQQLAEAIERERSKEAQALVVLEEKLKSSLQAAAIAHEINLPLSTLLLNSKLLLNRGDPPLAEPLKSSLQAIAQNADAVVATIEKMRTLLRNVQTDHQNLNLAQVARSALLYASPSLKAGQITVERLGLDDSQVVMGDAAQIQIALVNLLRNAIEAGASTIAVTLQRQHDTAVLTVADNGPGFQDPATAIQPLETSKPDGSGLGLFVVQTTMENHRGRLTIGRSSMGGAAVGLIFPSATQ